MGNRGKKVKAHYIGTLDDGSVFDSSVERGEPIEFACGIGQMIPGFDAAVESMELNETRKVHIPAAEAYGEYDERLLQRVPLDQIPNAAELPVGKTVYADTSNGPMALRVVEKNDEFAVFDMNHELAGKALNFEITLVEIIG